MPIAVIADIVGSRRLPDRASAQQALERAVATVERDLTPAARPLRPTVGDELQGVWDHLTDALISLLMLQLALPDGIAFRFGVGIGAVRGVASTHAELSDGPGWYAARDAIEIVHAREQRAMPRTRSWIVGAPDQDEVMRTTIAASNAYLLTRDEIVGALSERERRLTYGRLLGASQAELAEREGITQPSVSKSLRHAGAAALIEGVAALREARA